MRPVSLELQVKSVVYVFELNIRFEKYKNGFDALWTCKYQLLRIIESKQTDSIYLE